jgi:lysophospholipase L1-like esterase
MGTVLALLLGEAGARKLGLSKTWGSYVASAQLGVDDCYTLNKVGYHRRPNSTCRMPYGVMAASNAEGFRDEDWVTAPPQGLSRVAFLGDSVTEGFGVDAGQRFSEVACNTPEAQCESMNFGIASHCTVDQLVVLRQHVLKYKPNVVVLQIASNDILPNTVKWPMRLDSSAQRPAATRSAVQDRLRGSFFQRHSALYLSLAERWNTLLLRTGSSTALLRTVTAIGGSDWTATSRALNEIAAAATNASAAVVVTYVPLDVEVQTADETAAFAMTKRLTSHLPAAATFVDVVPELRSQRNLDLYLDDSHLSAKGHEVVGKALARRLLAIGVLRTDANIAQTAPSGEGPGR